MSDYTSTKTPKRSLLCTAAVQVLLLFVGCGSPNSVTNAPLSDDNKLLKNVSQSLFIELTGTEHRWQAVYKTTDGPTSRSVLRLSAADMHVPVGTRVILILNSTDYIYTLAIPEFALKEIAVPDLEFRMALRPTKCGTYALVGDEMCGAPAMKGPGRLIVEERADFHKWLTKRREQAVEPKELKRLL